MRILGIDPGYDRCGVAVLEASSVGSERLTFSHCIETNKKDDYHKRLFDVTSQVKQIIELYKPDLFAIENLFFNTNQKTATKISEIRGTLLYLALEKNIKILELTPLQIKLAVAGNGRADKKAVYEILPKLIKIEKNIKLDDEFDAIACALTASALRQSI